MGNLATILNEAHHSRWSNFNELIQQFNKDVTSMERILVTYGFIDPDKLKEVEYHLPKAKELKPLEDLFEQQKYLSAHFYNLVYGTTQIKSTEINFDTYDDFSDYATFAVAFVSQLSQIIEKKDELVFNRVSGTLRVIKRGARQITESLVYTSKDELKSNIAQSYMEFKKATLREREELTDFIQQVQADLIPKRTSLRKRIEKEGELDDELERELWEVEDAFNEKYKGEIDRYATKAMTLLGVQKPNSFEQSTYESFVRDLSLDDHLMNLMVHKRLGILSDMEKAKKEYAKKVDIYYNKLSKYKPMVEWVKKNYVNSMNRILQYEPFWNKVKRFITVNLRDNEPVLYGKNDKGETVEVPYLRHETKLEDFIKEKKDAQLSNQLQLSEKEQIVESYLRRALTLVEKTAEYLHDTRYPSFYYPQREYKSLVEIQERLSKARGRLKDDRQKYLSRVNPIDIE